MNINAAYTHYIDDGQWTSVGAIFAENGNKQVPFNGYYIGPERIAHRPGASPRPTRRTRPRRLALAAAAGDPRRRRRTLRQDAHAAVPPRLGLNPGGGIEGGMYPNNQAVLENGVWKLWSVTIDDRTSSASFPYGWAKAIPPRQPAPARPGASATATAQPVIPVRALSAERPQTLLGKRMEGFVGGTGDAIRWPSILPMWFHYKNPVSGRVPEFYWPDCGVCEYAPDTSMDKHGYLLPPS